MRIVTRKATASTRSMVAEVLTTLLIAMAGVVCVTAMPKTIRFASPLQSLTIPDPEVFEDMEEATTANEEEEEGTHSSPVAGLLTRVLATPRSKFLPRFLVGLQGEQQAREDMVTGKIPVDAVLPIVGADGPDWIAQTQKAEQQRKQQTEAILDQAHDTAMAHYEQQQQQQQQKHKKQNTANSPTTKNQYQFVGVIDNDTKKKKPKEEAVVWYARPKPVHSKWSVRLVHVNKAAIIKDLYDRGKIDIFAKYTNHGILQPSPNQKDDDGDTDGNTVQPPQMPFVTAKYEARERSWKTLWNFSPKHFFTDSSGAYWRERRLNSSPSASSSSSNNNKNSAVTKNSKAVLYTDGRTVYESTYRYRDGRNGMKRLSTLEQFMLSENTNLSHKEKQRIRNKLQTAAPDLVLEM